MLACGVVVALIPAYEEYDRLFTRLEQKEVLRSDMLYRVGGIINRGDIAHPYIYACSREQVLYYFTHSRIPTYIAHPDVILWDVWRAAAYQKEVGLEEIFKGIAEHRPAYIIGNPGSGCFDIFGDYMQRYERIFRYGALELWRMKAI